MITRTTRIHPLPAGLRTDDRLNWVETLCLSSSPIHLPLYTSSFPSRCETPTPPSVRPATSDVHGRDIALPRARRRCYNIAITRQSWPAVASRPDVAQGPRHSPYGHARAFARAPRASPGLAGQVNIAKLSLCLPLSLRVCCCLCPAFLQADTRGRSGQSWSVAEDTPWLLGVACERGWASSSCLQLRAATAAHATLYRVRAPGILVSFQVSRACVLCRRHAEGATCCGHVRSRRLRRVAPQQRPCWRVPRLPTPGPEVTRTKPSCVRAS